MARQVVLLRGVNVGGRNRLPMSTFRDLLAGAGFDEVRTYLQSGNAVLSTAAPPAEVARECRELLAGRLGLDVPVVVRTGEALAEVVRRDPLGAVAVDPRRHQVSFLSGDPGPDLLDALRAVATPAERVAVVGREIYAWHPDGIARSALWAMIAGRGLGVTATSRNWTTVTSLLALADGRAPGSV